MKIRYSSDWLLLGGIVLGIGIAILSVYQPFVAMALGLSASTSALGAWILSRSERKRDVLAAEQSLREVDQNAKIQIKKAMQTADLLIQQAQDDAEQRIQEIEERFEEYESNVSTMDERWNDEL